MKQKGQKAAFWLKGFVWLLVVMFLFTVASRAADTFTVAKVSVVSPLARKLQYRVSAEGRIEKNREISILTCPDLLVKSIQVNEGQRVKKGEVLAKLDKSSLKEQIAKIQDEKRTLELENAASEANKRQEQKKRQQEIFRARKDYEELKKKNEKALARAKKELDKAKEKLRKVKKEKKNETGKGEDLVKELQALAEEKRKAYQERKESGKAEEKAANRAIEDAMTDVPADNSAAIHQITIKNLNKELQKLQTVQKQNGKILAPKDGVITGIFVNVGQRTPDSGIFNMTDDSAGLKFVGQLTLEDAKYVSTGDLVTLHTTEREEEVSVTSLEIDESQEFMKITALLPAKSFSLGETALLQIVQETESYPCTVPATAVYQDNNKAYVYLVQKEDTILGKQEVARKMEIKVLEKNGTYAALDPDVLDSESRIVAESDRFVESGDRVRLKEGE